MSRIYLSFTPKSPHIYKFVQSSWAQISYHIYMGLMRAFPDGVTYIPYGDNIPMKKDDILITCIPNSQIKKIPERTIIVDNDNFDTNKWKYGKFKKYGLDAQTDHSSQFDDFFKGLFGAVIKTNEIALQKWNNNHPEILERKQFLQKNIKHIYPVPHPIDKDYFSKLYNPNYKIKQLKMLVYSCDWRKNGKQLIQMLKHHGFTKRNFTVINGIDKRIYDNVNRVLQSYSYLAHISYSEGFPYLANEFLCQGLMLFGHEEWWDAYGYEELRWSYDPEKQEQNLNKLKKILHNDFKEQYYAMRADIVNRHLARTDNNWSYLNERLVEIVNHLRG